MKPTVKNAVWMFAMIAVTASVPAFSQDAAVNFDQGVSAKAVLLTAKAKVEMNETDVPASPIPSTVYNNAENTPGTSQSSDGTGPQLFVLKDLLKDLPAADRSEFIGSLVFSNGHVVSAASDLLSKTLDNDKVNHIIGIIETNASRSESSAASESSLTELLNGVPDDIRTEFMDNLMYKKGVVVSAYVGGLETVLPEEAVNKILTTIYPAPEKSSIGTSRTLCDSAYCYGAVCSSHNDDPLTCKDKKNSTCGSECHS